jgi:glycosyltransferase involved in cell wall biosynthesis
LNKSVSILLSTYNGEDYLDSLLESLLFQEFTNFIVYIRDDFSEDNTLNIVNHYCTRFPNKFRLIKDNLGNLGVSKSFMQILSSVESDYYLFCDQDDVWLPNKISSLYNFTLRINPYTLNIPFLLFTDLKVVDSELNIIHNSYWTYQSIFPKISKSWKNLIAQNVGTGCTMLFNNPAKMISLPFVLDKMYHDHWLMVNAAKYGNIFYLKDTNILYRQHLSNKIGASGSIFYYFKKIPTIFNYFNFLFYVKSHFPEINCSKLIFYKLFHTLKRILHSLTIKNFH